MISIMKTLLVLLTAIILATPIMAEVPEFYNTVDRLIWVVEDMDATLAGLRKLGFTNLREMGEGEMGGEFRGNPSIGSARIVFGRLADVRVQWVEPGPGKNAFAEFHERHGSGVFSLMHRAPTAEAFAAEVGRMKSLGVEAVQQGSVDLPAGAVRYAFFDTEAGGKYSLGLIHFPEDDEGPYFIPPDNPSGRTVSQYAFAVRDLEPVSKYWASLGFAEMEVTHSPLHDKKYRGKPADFDMKLGWQRHGNVVYEWILSTKGPDTYRDHMAKHGEGFHHLAFNVEDMDADIEWWAGHGYPESMSGGWGEKGKPGSGRFTYVDAQALGGTDIELLWSMQ
jgi:glyoxalase/bleomycin resistance protein/dioxygenase superfamily protein